MLAIRTSLLVGVFFLARAPVAAAAPQAQLDWQLGPTLGAIGEIAEIQVPEGYVFLDGPDTRELLQAMGNPVSGRELATLTSASEDSDWFVFFEFSEVGYVKDDDGADLDADAILESIRQGNEQANEERRRRGWSTIDVVGWEMPPSYNAMTNNLEWAIRGRSEEGVSVNHNTRLLGRRGVMEVGLVCSPETLETNLVTAKNLLEGFSYRSGHSYAEYVKGDKVAEYGLAGLIAGGGLALAAKTGLLKKLWKLIVLAVVAVGAFLKRIFGGGRAAAEGAEAAE